MARRVITGKAANRLLYAGSRDLARLVEITYGPQGGKVTIAKLGEVVPTTDGTALVREVQFEDLRRLGASLIREASLAADKVGGDGSTTTVVLAHAILEQALEDDTIGTRNLIPVVNEIRAALPPVITAIREQRVVASQETLARVGFMASHGDEGLSVPILEALLAAGENGTVLLTEGDGVGVEVEHREGLTLPVGWATHALGDGTGERTLEGPLVAVVATPLSTFEDVRSLMEEASQWPGRGLVVFGSRITGEALTTLILNNKPETPYLAVQFHGGRDLRDHLEDVAAITNSEYVGVGHKHREWESPWLGSARRIVATRDKVTVFSYMDEASTARVDQRVASLLAQAEASTFAHDQDRMRERAAGLDGGLCTIKVGGFTQTEARERRSRAEDTLHALQGALRSGVVPGAGLAFLRASWAAPDTHGGYVLARALEAPLRALASRSRQEPEVVLSQDPGGPWTGWDPVTSVWRDFQEAPQVVDPLDVVVGALEAAVSVATQMLTTGAVIARDPSGSPGSGS